MLKLKLAAVAAAASLVGLMSAGGAQAAYQDPAIQIQIEDATIVGGNHFSGKATSDGVDCDWTVYYDGDTSSENPQGGEGTSVNFNFDTDPVDSVEYHDVTVTCDYDDGNGNEASTTMSGSSQAQEALYVPDSSRVLPAAPQTAERSATITLRPRGDDDDDDDDSDDNGGSNGSDNGALPDTGGPNALIIGAGVVLLVAGTGAVVVARRKGEQAA